MPKLVIDNKEVEVAEGATILDAAKMLGIEIPTMCFLEGHKPLTSCMVCLVKIEGVEALMPACGTPVRNGMKIQTDSQEVCQARRMALELLLSDHLGDCEGPCQSACPAHMNIPLMLRQIAAGRFQEAAQTVREDIALASVLGRICPAPCEKACRRGRHDQPVSICLLKRFAGDIDLAQDEHEWLKNADKTGKRITVVGSGPAGLSAAFYLSQMGYECVIYDDREKPGGMLRYGVEKDKLPEDTLDREIALLSNAGITFHQKTNIGRDISLDQLRNDYDAVFLAIGACDSVRYDGLVSKDGRVSVDSNSYMTDIEGVFAGGDLIRQRRLAVRSAADGKEAAIAINQYLQGKKRTGPIRPYNHRMGALQHGEMEIFLEQAASSARIEPASLGAGLSTEQAIEEAKRCLHCDCRKPADCKLRRYAQEYDVRPAKIRKDRTRRHFVQQWHPQIVFEPGKCISCEICITIARQEGEDLGLSFVGRGFDVQVEGSLHSPLEEALRKTARQCAQACPTGALSLHE